MSNELFIPIKFRTSVTIKPSELDINFEKTIITKIKKNYENVCSKYGYIKDNSIKILKRSIGTIKNQHFNGNISFDLICIAEICNPIQGSIIKCRVKAKNSLGVLAESLADNKKYILEIIIPKISAGIQSEINLDNIAVGQEIKIEVCGKKYQLFDKHISIIGRAIKNKDEFIKTAIIEDAEEEFIINEEEEPLDNALVDIEADEPLIEREEDEEEEKKEDDDEEEEEEEEELIDEDDLDEDISISGGDDEYAGGDDYD
jgi:DNA-directed RNA polymerase subunit E'/Rpb7